jgi:hypothetical protein
MKLYDLLEGDFSGDYTDTVISSNKHVSKDEAKKLILSEYSQAFKNAISDKILYKGIRNDEFKSSDFLVSSSYKVKRKSANTGNGYTILFSEVLDSWKKYPRRDQSVICTNEYSVAKSYAELDEDNVFVMLPINNTPIGICPKSDLWFSFDTGLSQLNKLDIFTSALRDIKRKPPKELYDLADLSEILSVCEAYGSLEHILKKDSDFMNHKYDGKNTIYKALNAALDPKLNNFKLSKSPPNISDDIMECWFSAPCLMIRETVFEEFKNEVR